MNDANDGPKYSYRSMIVVAVVLLLGLLFTAGFKSYRDLAAARARQVELERQIETSIRRVEQLREHVRRIEEDPDALERLAREELGMVRPGDVVIVLPEERVALSGMGKRRQP